MLSMKKSSLDEGVVRCCNTASSPFRARMQDTLLSLRLDSVRKMNMVDVHLTNAVLVCPNPVSRANVEKPLRG